MVSDRFISNVGIADIGLKTVNYRKLKPESSSFPTGIIYTFSGTTCFWRSVVLFRS